MEEYFLKKRQNRAASAPTIGAGLNGDDAESGNGGETGGVVRREDRRLKKFADRYHDFMNKGIKKFREYQIRLIPFNALGLFVLGLVALGIQENIGTPNGDIPSFCTQLNQTKSTIEILLLKIPNSSMNEEILQTLNVLKEQTENITDGMNEFKVCEPISISKWLAGFATLFIAFLTISDTVTSFITLVTTVRVHEDLLLQDRRKIYYTLLYTSSCGAAGTFLTLFGTAKFFHLLPDVYFVAGFAFCSIFSAVNANGKIYKYCLTAGIDKTLNLLRFQTGYVCIFATYFCFTKTFEKHGEAMGVFAGFVTVFPLYAFYKNFKARPLLHQN